MEEHQKKKALDIARKTRGLTEDILIKYVDGLSHAEKGVTEAKDEEAVMVRVIQNEVVYLVDLQRRELQTQMLSLVHARSKVFKYSFICIYVYL
jgi:hypothetical protein